MILTPFFLVWGLYFFWRGKTSVKWFDFALSGLFLGLGFYVHHAYYVMPVVVILTLLAYWHAVNKDFGHEKYLQSRHQLIRGFALLMLVAMFVALPWGWYRLVYPSEFLTDTTSMTTTLLFWPVGVLFVIGFIRSLMKLFKSRRTHGHYATVQVLLLSWFLLGILPIIVMYERLPDALDALLVIPVVFIFAGEGLWWLYDFCRKWYGIYDQHDVVVHEHTARESRVVAIVAICLLLGSIMVNEYRAFFDEIIFFLDK